MVNKIVLFCLICSGVLVVNFGAGAAVHPAAAGAGGSTTHVSVLESEEPQIIFCREGLFSVSISGKIIQDVRDGINAVFPAEDGGDKSLQLNNFERAISNSEYLAPGMLDMAKFSLKEFRTFAFEFRTEHGLPEFSTTSFSSTEECFIALKDFVLENITGDSSSQSEVLALLEAQKAQFDADFAENFRAYEEFYESLSVPFAPLGVLNYIYSLLGFDGDGPITEASMQQLKVLQEAGFLELLSPLQKADDGAVSFRPSLAPQVEKYVADGGSVSSIVLGCAHSNHRDLLESFGLPSDVWCGACDKTPHMGQMVVSLHEPSADVLGNLNDNTLWGALGDGVVQEICDETWCLNRYATTTFEAIFRVLKPGGVFVSNSYDSESNSEARSALVALGFEIVEEAESVLKVKKPE